MAYDMDSVELSAGMLPADLAAAIAEAAESGARTLITRHGKPIAAIVAADEAAMLEEHEDTYFSQRADEALAAHGDKPFIPAAEVWADLDAEDTHRAAA